MLDGEVSNAEMVWGFKVPIRPNGRKSWPTKLRAMAVERIAAGAGIREIAEEIGAHKSLVSQWTKAAKVEQDGPKFFEVLAPSSEGPASNKKSILPAIEDAMVCRIRIGAAEITIPPGYPANDLHEILRLVRLVQ